MNNVPQQQTIIANKKIVQYCTLFCDLLLILLFYSVLTSVQTRHTKCCYVLFDIKISKPKQRAVTLRLTDSKSRAICFLLFSSSCPHCLIHTNSRPLSFFVFVIVFVRHLAIETSSENLNSNLSSLYVPYCAVPSQDYSLALSFSFSLYFTFPLSVSFILSSFVHICLTKQQKKLFLNQRKTFFHGIPSQKAHRSENENNCAYLLGINEQKVKCNRDSSTQDHENPD